jgi:hypothetical protein
MFLRLWISQDRSYKAYIALFVWFVTRALYLELVSDSTTSSFIAAFRRFTSRRGLYRYLYSDNLTTFKEVDNELQNMFKSASTFYNKIGAILLMTERFRRSYHQTNLITAVYGKPGLSP